MLKKLLNKRTFKFNCRERIRQSIRKVKCRASRYSTLFTCNKLMCSCKSEAHIANYLQLRQLKRAKGDAAQLVCFYTTCIRPVSEYACQVFHNGLPKYLSEELENIQRRALRIIFPVLSYQEALKECNIATLYQRHQLLTERLFSEIKDNTCHKLHGLLPSCNLSTVALRRKRAFNVPFCRTNRLNNSFIMYNVAIS